MPDMRGASANGDVIYDVTHCGSGGHAASRAEQRIDEKVDEGVATRTDDAGAVARRV